MLADLPSALLPTSVEVFSLSKGNEIRVPKATPSFIRWHGDPIPNDRGKKPVLDWGGEPLFAELVILRLLQTKGWEGVWVDTYGKARRRSLYDNVLLPEQAESLLKRIRIRAGIDGGCFDVFVWKEDEIMFAESKRAGRDRFRASQLRWLDGALQSGLQVRSFLVVEWSLKKEPNHADGANSRFALAAHPGRYSL